MSENTLELKVINLALQGGGAHGAFTWGVLDRLLEDERLVIEGVSGTSAGAMNAAVMADGFEKGGAAEARAALERFWRAMSEYGSFSPYRSGPFNWAGSPWSLWAQWFHLVSHMVSPYQLNPLNVNPLRDVLANTIDFRRLRTCECMKLYISATNVRTNRLHIFTSTELSVEVLLASACLPQLFQAVEIDGEYYWDGGYMGNPVLEPLVGRCDAADIVVVQVNPTYRESLPRTAEEISDRLNEITFNASLMREIRTIAAVTRLVEEGIIQDLRYERTYFHRIAAEEALEGLGAETKLDTSWSFLTRLRDLGRERADQWLAETFHHLGKNSTLDLSAWRPTNEEEAGALYCRV